MRHINRVFQRFSCLAAIAGALCGAAAAQSPSIALSGTNVVTGTITDDRGRPVAGASLTLAQAGMDVAAVSDDNGVFALTAIPAGAWILKADRPGFVTTRFGQRGLYGPPSSIRLTRAQRLRVQLRMSRTAVIAGRVMTAEGPAIAAHVLLSRKRMTAAEKDVFMASATTNARGDYRAANLPPGEYTVSALPPSPNRIIRERDSHGVDRDTRYVESYFNGGWNAAGGTPVRVGPGDTRLGIDLSIERVEVTRLEVVAHSGDGLTPSLLELWMPSTGELTRYASDLHDRPFWSDGRFVVNNVVPGEYCVEVTEKMSTQSAPTRSGSTVVSVSPRVPISVDVELKPVTTISGRLSVDLASPSTPDRIVIADSWIKFAPVGGSPCWTAPDIAVGGMQSGPFSVSVSQGTYLVLPGDPYGAFLKSATIDGKDILNHEIKVGPEGVSNLVVEGTDQPAGVVQGQLLDADGRPIADGMVLLFPIDTDGKPLSASVKLAVSSADGHFEIGDLKTGQYAVALTTVATIDDVDERVLASLGPGATRVTLKYGETTQIQVRARR